MISIAVHRADNVVIDIKPEEVTKWLETPDALVWVDINKTNDSDYLWLARYFEFHPLAMQDVLARHLRPKMDVFHDHAFMVFYGVRLDEGEGGLKLVEVELFFGKNFVITLHDEPIPELQGSFQRWCDVSSSFAIDTISLLYTILDTLLDNYFTALDWVAERLDNLENRILEQYDKNVLRDVVQLKQGLLHMRKVVGPQRDAVNVLLRGEATFLPTTSQTYLHDLYDHTLRIVESVDAFRDMAATVMDGFRSAQSNEINEIMRRLTVINLLFLPLAVLTGFFGMNFEFIPFGSPYLLIVAIIGMVGFPMALLYYLRYKHWM